MTWRRFVAVGDSFTEGLEDRRMVGGHLGWADRFATILAERDPETRYANLAIRGRRLEDIVDRQLPAALAMRPDLVSIAGGVNDALRPRWNISKTADLLESGVVTARESGADVLVFAFGDISHRSKTLGSVGGRLRDYRDLTLAIAAAHECYVVDFWGESIYDDHRLWAQDRLHLNEIGHERVSRQVAQTLGIGKFDWRVPLPPAPKESVFEHVRSDLEWTARHLVPWVGRRLQRKSSGDDVQAKRPQLAQVETNTLTSS